MMTTQEILLKAKKVSQNAPLSEGVKNNALKAMAESLLNNCEAILKANELDVEKGLDLILHTPGGDVAATESIIDYLNNIFEKISEPLSLS